MRKIRILAFMCLAVSGGASFAVEATSEGVRPRKVALVVQNHCAPSLGLPMMSLTDALAAKLSVDGLQVINPYNAIGTDLNRTVAGEKLPQVSALDAAQGLDADGLVTASVIEFNDSTVGNPPLTHTYSIRVAFNLADAQSGATVCGDTLKLRSPQYTIAQVSANRKEYLDELLHFAASACAESLVKKAAGWHPAPSHSPVVQTPEAKERADAPLDLGPKVPVTPREKLRRGAPPPADGDFTMSDFDRMFGFLVKAMLDDSRFRENYDDAQNEKSGLPIVIVGGVVNKSDGAASQAYADLLKAIPDTLRIELFNSALFDVKHDEMSATFAQRILASDKSPVEDGELMNALKQHGSPDFVIVGDSRLFVDHGKRKSCRVHLALHSLKTGKVVWEGKKTAIK